MTTTPQKLSAERLAEIAMQVIDSHRHVFADTIEGMSAIVFRTMAKDLLQHISALGGELAERDKWLGRRCSSNPDDHGMVVDKPIEGVPGMASWRLRTNDEWLDLKEKYESELSAFQAEVADLKRRLSEANMNHAIDDHGF